MRFVKIDCKENQNTLQLKEYPFSYNLQSIKDVARENDIELNQRLNALSPFYYLEILWELHVGTF